MKKFIPRLDSHLLIIFGLPFLLLTISDNWMFPGPGIDPWYYFGYFVNFEQYLPTFFPIVYHGSRFSWVIPGYLANQLFSPVIANYVFHLSFYYATVISLYLILKYTVGRHVGLFTAVLLGSYFYFLKAIGSNYVDGGGIAYLLLTTLMLTLAVKFAYQYLWLFLAGFFYGALVYTNLFLVSFTPSLMIYYWMLPKRHSILNRWLAFMAGLVTITLLFSLIHYLITKNFFFYQPSINFILNNLNQANPWKAPSYAWVTTAPWLILPILILLTNMVFLIKSQHHFFSSIFSIYFVLNLSIFVFLEARGLPVLQFPYYASYLIPVTFLALGSQFSTIYEAFPSKYQFPIIIFGGITLIILNTLSLAYGDKTTGPTHREAFLAILKSMKIIEKVLGKEANYPRHQFWYSDQDPFGQIYLSLSSLYIVWDNNKFPIFKKDTFAINRQQRLGPTDNIMIVLTTGENIFSQAQQSLNAVGLDSKLIAEETIAEGPVNFKMFFLELNPAPQTISQLLQQAIQYHQTGNLPQAENLYRQILQAQPNHLEALHFLGVIAGQMGNYETAIELIKKSITLNHTLPLLYVNLAGTLRLQGNLAEAIACYQHALSLNPSDTKTQQQLDEVLTLQNQASRPNRETDPNSPCLRK